ncbi:hypothetical protein ABZ703_37190, partial [Streptomyces massasporeus]|uniref:hypothetical protein n=1 Tax=Streptomyces massasporeus TaxID=67324 RepID=UPI0033D9F840
ATGADPAGPTKASRGNTAFRNRCSRVVGRHALQGRIPDGIPVVVDTSRGQRIDAGVVGG